jgi:hypothetical protein
MSQLNQDVAKQCFERAFQSVADEQMSETNWNLVISRANEMFDFLEKRSHKEKEPDLTK